VPVPDRRAETGTRPAVVITGAPATGKSTMARELVGQLGGALLDQDVATGPMVHVVSRLIGVHDLDDPALAGLTRDARYETLVSLAVDNLRAGSPVVLVAPFTAERRDAQAWRSLRRQLAEAGGRPMLVWLSLPVEEILRRLRRRAAPRDAAKLTDELAYAVALAELAAPPAVPHLAVDGMSSPPEQARRVLEALSD
jgi:predicted kinase